MLLHKSTLIYTTIANKTSVEFELIILTCCKFINMLQVCMLSIRLIVGYKRILLIPFTLSLSNKCCGSILMDSVPEHANEAQKSTMRGRFEKCVPVKVPNNEGCKTNVFSSMIWKGVKPGLKFFSLSGDYNH